jgi:hypothetical protein
MIMVSTDTELAQGLEPSRKPQGFILKFQGGF